MAHRDRSLPENAPGDFFVDDTCIDCGACRQLAPASFASLNSATEQAYVARQPVTPDQVRRAALALVACPTSSIGSRRKAEIATASRAFPESIGDCAYDCGYASERSFGARSYLVRRAEGNVLVDSPRFAKPLVERIEALGGIDLMFLTHRDDVADHAKFHAHFGADRILHVADRSSDTRDVERLIEGSEPVALADDLLVIPVPGHTRGSIALLHGEVLFTGDHLWGAEHEHRLHASRSVCWYSWAKQTESMARLLGHRFRRVLPGHGMRFETPDPERMHTHLARLVDRMRHAVEHDG